MRLNQELLKAEANNFTAVRLLLASSVIYSHSYWSTTGVEGRDDLTDYLGASVGTCAVYGFFFLSGFLVYPSLLRLESSARFLLARFTRLWPGLAVATILTVLGGWTMTSTPGLAYLIGDTIDFIASNLSFLRGHYTLTGVRCGTELCNVNGSLWTLPWEARCYLVLALLGVLGLARPSIMVRFVLPSTLAFVIIWNIDSVPHWVGNAFGHGPAYMIGQFQQLWGLFALGIAAFLLHRRLILSWWILGGLLLVNFMMVRTPQAPQALKVLVGYGVLCLGFLTARNGSFSGRWPDYSYGTYIYAFPIMVAVHAIWPAASRWALAASTLAATIPVAMLSWHLVERPALDLLRRHGSVSRKSSAPAKDTAVALSQPAD